MALTDPIIQFKRNGPPFPSSRPPSAPLIPSPLLLAGVPALRKIPGLATLEDAGGRPTSPPFPSA